MGDRPRLLVCDDPAQTLEEELPLFRDLGWACTYVQSVDDLSGGELQPDAVILSGRLPGGPEGRAFARLQRAFPHAPLLVVASVRSLSTAVAFFRAGADDYLSMPLARDETRQRLTAALEGGRRAGAHAVSEVSAELAGGEVLAKRTGATSIPGRAPAEGGPLREGCIDLEALGCGVWVCDGEGRLVAANAAALSLVARPSREDLGRCVARPIEVWEPLDARGCLLSPEAWPPFRALKDHAPRAGTMSLLRPDGTRVRVHLHATFRQGSEKGPWICVALCEAGAEHG